MNRDGSLIRLARNPPQDVQIRTILDYAVEGAASIGEVLAATAGVNEDDHQSWISAWNQLAQRSVDIADGCAAQGRPISASEAYLRASTYFSVAVHAMAALPDAGAVTATSRKQRVAWEAFVALAPVRTERVDIPLAQTSLPGYLFRPAKDQATGATVVAVGGSDGGFAELWARCAAAALRRGYNVLVFDGPGERSRLHERNALLRADWESVLTPVYNFVSRRQGVDPTRIVLYGLRHGSYSVARALTCKHRFAAAVADPGTALPPPLMELQDEDDNDSSGPQMCVPRPLSCERRSRRSAARPHRADTDTQAIEGIHEDALVEASETSTPLLIITPADAPPWQRQALASLSPVAATDGWPHTDDAPEHRGPLPRPVTTQRIFDWLDARTLHQQ